jgi:hypothetical protein
MYNVRSLHSPATSAVPGPRTPGHYRSGCALGFLAIASTLPVREDHRKAEHHPAYGRQAILSSGRRGHPHQIRRQPGPIRRRAHGEWQPCGRLGEWRCTHPGSPQSAGHLHSHRRRPNHLLRRVRTHSGPSQAHALATLSSARIPIIVRRRKSTASSPSFLPYGFAGRSWTQKLQHLQQFHIAFFDCKSRRILVPAVGLEPTT